MSLAPRSLANAVRGHFGPKLRISRTGDGARAMVFEPPPPRDPLQSLTEPPLEGAGPGDGALGGGADSPLTGSETRSGPRFIDNDAEVSFRRGLLRTAREGFDVYVADDARAAQLGELGPLEQARINTPDGAAERPALRMSREVRAEVTAGRFGATRVQDTGRIGTRPYEARDLVLAYNDKTPPREIALDFGLDPERLDIANAVEVDLTRVRNHVRQVMGDPAKLKDLSARWAVDEAELRSFVEVGSPAKPGANSYRTTPTLRAHLRAAAETGVTDTAGLRAAARKWQPPGGEAFPNEATLKSMVSQIRKEFGKAAQQLPRFTAEQSVDIRKLRLQGRTPAEIADRLGLDRTKINNEIYDMRNAGQEFPALPSGGRPAKRRFARAQRRLERASRTDIAEIEAAVGQAWGGLGQQLIDGGVLVVVPNRAAVPTDVGDIPPWVGGVAIGDKAYLIADRLTPERVQLLVLHEIGVHHGLEKMIGGQRYKGLVNGAMRRLERARKAEREALDQGGLDIDPGDDFWLNVAWEVEQLYGEGHAHFGDELLAYAAERADLELNLLPEDHPDRAWWQQLLDMVRRWAVTTFNMGEINARDVHTLAVASLKRTARQASKEPVGVVDASRVLRYAQAKGFDGTDAVAAARWLDERGFFSAVRVAAETTTTRSAPAAQWWATISKAPGVKKEELEWMGLKDWLDAQPGPVAREDLQAFVRQNGVVVEETVLSDQPKTAEPSRVEAALQWLRENVDDNPEEHWGYSNDQDYVALADGLIQEQMLPLIEEKEKLQQQVGLFRDNNGEERWNDSNKRLSDEQWKATPQWQTRQKLIDKAITRIGEIDVSLQGMFDQQAVLRGQDGPAQFALIDGSDRTKWSQYTLPGGENYRELLLRLPVERADIAAKRSRFQALNDRAEATEAKGGELTPAEYAEMQTLRDEIGPYPGDGRNVFRSSHFDQRNILAHVRFKERTDAEGRRTLFIEEVQSDWHQKGREKGYRATAPTEGWRAEKAASGDRWVVYDQNGEFVDTTGAQFDKTPEEAIAAAALRRDLGTVPDAPFKDNKWAALALKRMIRWAAENGFEQIAWTRGQHQVERFNLSHVLGNVEAVRVKDRVSFTPSNGRRDARQALQQFGEAGSAGNTLMARTQAMEAFGKETGARLFDEAFAKNGETHTFYDEDLKVGGSGMRAFYDKILPNLANDLGKKFGARVGETQVNVPTKFGNLAGTPEIAFVIEPRGDGARWQISVDGSRVPDTDLYPTREAAALGRQEVIAAIKGKAESVHALQIPPDMARAVMQSGQALFGAARPTTLSRRTGAKPNAGDAVKKGLDRAADANANDYRFRKRPGARKGLRDSGAAEAVIGNTLGVAIGGTVAALVASEQDREERRQEYLRLEEERRKSDAQAGEREQRREANAELQAAIENHDWRALPEMDAALRETGGGSEKGREAYVRDLSGWVAQMTGIESGFIQALIARETAYTFHPDIQPITRDGRLLSNALGLGQFIPDTWASELIAVGDDYGIAIEGRNRKAIASDESLLELRRDPRLAAALVGEHTRRNALQMQEELGRDVSGGELYAAHFMGVDRAIGFIEDAEAGLNPAQTKTKYAREARANAHVFTPGGRARAARDILAEFGEEFGTEAMHVEPRPEPEAEPVKEAAAGDSDSG